MLIITIISPYETWPSSATADSPNGPRTSAYGLGFGFDRFVNRLPIIVVESEAPTS